MIIINTTYHVSRVVEKEWLDWVNNLYIPKVISTGILQTPRLLRVFVEKEENAEVYALQFEVENFDKLEYWSDHHSREFKNEMSDLFAERVLGFTTVMETL